MDANYDRIDASVVWTVGALFDYVAGRVPRAPHWIADNGLEWIFRLVVEPRRMWRRYLLGNPAFLYEVLNERRRRRSGPDAGRWRAGAIAIAALAIAANCGVKGVVGACDDVARGAAARCCGARVARPATRPRGCSCPRADVAEPGRCWCRRSGARWRGARAHACSASSRVPIEASVAVVLLLGAAAAVVVRRASGPGRGPRRSLRVRGRAALHARLARATWALVLALHRPDPGAAGGLRHGAGLEPRRHARGRAPPSCSSTRRPGEVNASLPVDRMPPVWRSKYPIYYALRRRLHAVGARPRGELRAPFAAVLAVLGGGRLHAARPPRARRRPGGVAWR